MNKVVVVVVVLTGKYMYVSFPYFYITISKETSVKETNLESIPKKIGNSNNWFKIVFL